MDPTRAPAGRQTAWAYAHVPHGSTVDAAEVIAAEVERAAPGFRDLVLARHARTAAAHEAYNPNYVGGDIGGGLATLPQVIARPTLAATRTARRSPASTSAPRRRRPAGRPASPAGAVTSSTPAATAPRRSALSPRQFGGSRP